MRELLEGQRKKADFLLDKIGLLLENASNLSSGQPERRSQLTSEMMDGLTGYQHGGNSSCSEFYRELAEGNPQP